jgi:hypothetical protein
LGAANVEEVIEVVKGDAAQWAAVPAMRKLIDG